MRHYALVTLFYSLLISSSVLNENFKGYNDIKKQFLVNSNNNLNEFNGINVEGRSFLSNDKKDLLIYNQSYLVKSKELEEQKSIKNETIGIGIEDFLKQLTSTFLRDKRRLDLDGDVAGEDELFKNDKELEKKSSSDFFSAILDNARKESNLNENMRVFFNMTEHLAHSVKFFIYIFFSVHFKFYFRFLKNKNYVSNLLTGSNV